MTRAVVLGGGMVGSVMAVDLAQERGVRVTVADARPAALAGVRERARRAGVRVETVEADLASAARVRALALGADVVLGAMASGIAFNALKTVIEAGRPYADISFMAEDAWDLDGLARRKGVCAAVDIGVAPGMSHVCAAQGARRLTRCESIEIYVGGLPRERRWPFEYKAAFSPADVIEEYTRPTRLVEKGRVVVRPALSEPELMDFEGVGTLEAFNTDGLRSLVVNRLAPDMKEKTLRYPGHIGLMRALRETGFFGTEPVEAGGVRVSPRAMTAALMFPKWSYGPGEEDLTVMRVVCAGRLGSRRARLAWDLLDFYDRASGATSMSRTTAFPCAIVARLLASGRLTRAGVLTPDRLPECRGVYEALMKGHAERGVRYRHRREVVTARRRS
ncbi:MAG: saccharopine dehydrogenase NADP-binding domain-containing protein [Phycisphaeraceae bacterium]|nr:saccharopine dehydrogenase NADP-binding domain-containing protein [Phycisphaeraceae bacterium]